ncbi:hypothetical protein [Absicoccus porci]|uniref:hypothetical protein n=1 Tax=Absicoccus porci TaxID=2486576 RepID=UPI00374D644B
MRPQGQFCLIFSFLFSFLHFLTFYHIRLHKKSRYPKWTSTLQNKRYILAQK